MTGQELLTLTVCLLASLIVVIGLLQNTIQFVQLVMATLSLYLKPQVRLTSQLWRRFQESAPPISLMAPAFNEERTIVESVRSLLNLNYPEFEVIVVNDGSTDGTMDVLAKEFGLTPIHRSYRSAVPCASIRGIYAAKRQPRLVVVDKVNGGKADALNAAINIARCPLVCTIDADSLLEPGALLRAAQPFIEDPERVIAVGGSINIANGCRIDRGQIVKISLPRNWLALFQTVEYLRAFLMARLAWSHLNALTIISGAFGLFDRSAVVQVGGYSQDTVGEDMELVVKLHRWCRDHKQDYRIAFVSEPVCWTEAPETFRDLARQRRRWQRGSLETFAKHADMLLSPHYGRIAVLGMTQVILTDVLGPNIEMLGYLAIPVCCFLGIISWWFFWAFLCASVGFGVAISVGGLLLEEAHSRKVGRATDLLILLLFALAENFGYRQLSNIWRVEGTWQYLTGVKSWGAMSRKGFHAPQAIYRSGIL